MESSSKFEWEDYVVFGCMLAVSSVIGIFFALRNMRRKETSSEEMLTGGRSLPVLPVALSLSAGFTAGTTLLGIPAEVYSRGGEQWLWCFGLVPCFLIVAFFILPVFYRLRLTNAYEYLELRFNKTIRSLGSILFSAIILTYMAAVLYAPAVALSQVTGLSREISVLAMGLVCTFYTSIGGIRAVVWTDAFQLVVVWAGLMVLMFKGASDVGGWSKVWNIADQGSRLPRFDMNPDPFVRHTFWTLLIGGCTNMMTVYGANQTNLQRYASVRTLKGAQCALLLCLPLWIFYLTVLCLIGLVMYAAFTCDPLTTGTVSKKDQLVPLFVLETMGSWPGLPGLFVASIFSASISTVSSGVNSLAAVTLEDVIRPFYKFKNLELSKRAALFITVVLGIIYGGLTVGLAYLADFLGRTALTISFGVFGMVGGPLLGLILNGIFMPFVNSWGAGVGLVTSLTACLYVGIYPVFNPPPSGNLPFRTDGCVPDNLTRMFDDDAMSTLVMTTADYGNITTASSASGGSSHLYLSYIHYSTLALIISMPVAALVSLITGFNKGRVVDARTHLKYSCFSSTPKTPSSYNFHHDSISEHNGANLDKHTYGEEEFNTYANHGVSNPYANHGVSNPSANHGAFKTSESNHPNQVYANM